MVSDTNNKTYTELMVYLKTLFPNIDGSQKLNTDPAKFPFCFFFQIDSMTTGQTLSVTEDVIRVAYQIDIYSKKSMDEARKITDAVRRWMIEHGFKCIGSRPLDFDTPYRFVSRYQRLETEIME